MNDYLPSITVNIQPGDDNASYKVVSFTGNLDKAGLESVRTKVEEVIDTVKSEKFVVFDFKNLEFINSESIGFLLMLHTRLVKKGAKLVIVHAIDHVKDVLDVIGMLKIIEYYPTLEEFRLSL
ncbi:STAS domain-containing protein [Patescibacteria group bacterium]|nr:STAS domain-containing protein [Patescibacteria group bacterium]MBU1702919.1 STAS domain-containing protein [Patescibacteria group bacterium]MBU1953491.1 STAS domain-containing protein [Patescibacteria group bacterium]